MIVVHGFQKTPSLMEGQRITGIFQPGKQSLSRRQNLRLKVNFRWETKETTIQQNFLRSKKYFKYSFNPKQPNYMGKATKPKDNSEPFS